MEGGARSVQVAQGGQGNGEVVQGNRKRGFVACVARQGRTCAMGAPGFEVVIVNVNARQVR